MLTITFKNNAADYMVPPKITHWMPVPTAPEYYKLADAMLAEREETK